MKNFILAFVLCSTALSSYAHEVKAYDCLSDTGNMKRMTVTFTEFTDSSKYQVSIFFTKADPIITNRHLTGTSVLGAQDTHLSVAMDKDPYDGQVGLFYWTFRFPLSFLNGSVPEDFGSEETQRAAYKWEGTPSGWGNNSGAGFVEDWVCRSLNG